MMNMQDLIYGFLSLVIVHYLSLKLFVFHWSNLITNKLITIRQKIDNAVSELYIKRSNNINVAFLLFINSVTTQMI